MTTTNIPVSPTKADLIAPVKKRGDAGYDLRAIVDEPVEIYPGEIKEILTGFSWAIPENYFGLITPRSGLGTRGLVLANTVGIVDSTYRGIVTLQLMNRSTDPIVVKNEDRVCQMIIIPCLHANIFEVSRLSETSRGESGFGSSGVE